MVGNIRVADVLEEEGAVVANEPAGECEEEFAKGGMNIEEVGPLEVIGRELRSSKSVLIAIRGLYLSSRLYLSQHTLPKCTSSKTT